MIKLMTQKYLTPRTSPIFFYLFLEPHPFIYNVQNFEQVLSRKKKKKKRFRTSVFKQKKDYKYVLARGATITT